MTTYTASPRAINLAGNNFDHHLVRSRSIGIVVTREQLNAIRSLAAQDGLAVSRWVYEALSSYDLEALKAGAEAGLRVLASLTELDSRLQHSREQVTAAREHFVQTGDADSLQQAARATSRVFAYEEVRNAYLSAPKPKREARVTFNVDPYTAMSLHHHAFEVGLRMAPFINLILAQVLYSRGYGEAVLHQRLGEVHDGVGITTSRHVYNAIIKVADRQGFKSLTATKVVQHCTTCSRKPVALPRPRPKRDSTYMYKTLRALRAEDEARRAALADRVLVPA